MLNYTKYSHGCELLTKSTMCCKYIALEDHESYKIVQGCYFSSINEKE